MILGYGDTMENEGVNNLECSSEEITLGDFHRFRTTFESCTALATHIAMSPATCPTPTTYRVHIAFAGKHSTLSEKVVKRHHWHISNTNRFKPAIHAFMQAAMQSTNEGTHITRWNTNVARIVYENLLAKEKELQKRAKRERYFERMQRATNIAVQTSHEQTERNNS